MRKLKELKRKKRNDSFINFKCIIYILLKQCMYIKQMNNMKIAFFETFLNIFSFGLNTKVYDNALKHVLNKNIYICINRMKTIKNICFKQM